MTVYMSDGFGSENKIHIPSVERVFFRGAYNYFADFARRAQFANFEN